MRNHRHLQMTIRTLHIVKFLMGRFACTGEFNTGFFKSKSYQEIMMKKGRKVVKSLGAA